MKRILTSDRLPGQARWVNLSRSRFPTLVPREKVFPVAL